MKTDVLVIGGGPAGLLAAYEAAASGRQVTIVEESWSLGGQLRQQTQVLEQLPAPYTGARGFVLAERLLQQLEPLSVDVLLEHAMIGRFADGSIGISNEQQVHRVAASSVIVATGAAETPVAFPGWTLPGVMTPGAVQIAINRERVLPGKKALMVGSSDFAIEVVRQMREVGIDVLAVVEQSGAIQARRKENRQYAAEHVPLLLGTELCEAKGTGRVEQAFVRKSGSDQPILYEVDLICTDGGRHPILEPFSILDCKLAYRQQLGGWLPVYNRDLQTSVEGIFVAGNAAGVSSQVACLLTGKIAGISAAAHVSSSSRQEQTLRKQELWLELHRIENECDPSLWAERVNHLSQGSNLSLSRDPSEWLHLLGNGRE
ncbi:NAD(P)/FAD-dependent oxidoreductase [Brevibacillus massiliensis]|uniref:NAD(P)/FAD-dependent oxidoreductase n=1 Tax=Brevibacillus massiliensis TaxID=1118054 RepID=UPI0002E47739|nr:NAD(P)/FAD-dependent oxidoreductase [Brevibacillus massiliensis]